MSPFSTFVVLVLGSHFTFISASDTFVCKKAERRSKYKSVSLIDENRVNFLEDKIVELEDKLDTALEMSQPMPDVIKVQSAGHPRDCNEIYEGGELVDGVYEVSPDGRCPFKVYCDMTNGGWTVIQRRINGNVDFRRKWADYEHGFGDLKTDFWLGLEKIHRLTQDGSEIFLTLYHYDISQPKDWAHYQSFVVRDFTSSYKMNVDAFGYNGSLSDLFSYHNGFKFSTYDRDNDMFSSSCSEQYGGGGGWWYDSCYRLGTFNAAYGNQSVGGISYWNAGYHFVKNTEIKVKPRDGMC